MTATITSLPCDADPDETNPAWQLPTITATSLHVNADTKIVAERQTSTYGEYLTLDYICPRSGARVTIYLDDDQMQRTISELQDAYLRPVVK